MTTTPLTTEPTRRCPQSAGTKTPSTHFAFAIVSTVLFWPVGAFAIVASRATTKAIAAGAAAAAVAASARAKLLAVIASAVGALVWVLAAVGLAITLTGTAGIAEGPYKGPGVATYDLVAGTCFTAPTASMTPAVTPIDCAQPHTAEIYNTIELPAGAYPGKAKIVEAAAEACLGTALSDYVGDEKQAAAYSEHYLAPSEEFWSAGKRSLVCFLSPIDEGGELTGSVAAK
jgi:hypothetical protein